MDDDAMRSHVTQTIAEKYACTAPHTLLWSNLAALYNNHCTLYTSVLSSLFAPFSHSRIFKLQRLLQSGAPWHCTCILTHTDTRRCD